MPEQPSMQEIAEAEKAAREALEKMTAIPEEERVPLLSKKFSGAIGETPNPG